MPDKLQREADFRFSRVHQYASQSVSGFYDRYLQEVGTWTEVGNTFFESEIIIEGDDPDADIDEGNVQVRAIRARIHLKSEK